MSRLNLFVPADTPWYKLWVVDNAKHHKSTVAQVGEGAYALVILLSH